jgi:hypothetical protein
MIGIITTISNKPTDTSYIYIYTSSISTSSPSNLYFSMSLRCKRVLLQHVLELSKATSEAFLGNQRGSTGKLFRGISQNALGMLWNAEKHGTHLQALL